MQSTTRGVSGLDFKEERVKGLKLLHSLNQNYFDSLNWIIFDFMWRVCMNGKDCGKIVVLALGGKFQQGFNELGVIIH